MMATIPFSTTGEHELWKWLLGKGQEAGLVESQRVKAKDF